MTFIDLLNLAGLALVACAVLPIILAPFAN